MNILTAQITKVKDMGCLRQKIVLSDQTFLKTSESIQTKL